MNSRISVLEVRLIASNGDQVGVVDTQKALELAKEGNLSIKQDKTFDNIYTPSSPK